MKIRTRLLLVLLPAFLGVVALTACIAFYSGSEELFPSTNPSLNRWLLATGALSILLTITSLLYLMANQIARPMQKLSDSALAIAAGQYGESVRVQGPKEIQELSNILNTLSECLHEQINRLKDSSRLREQLYGEEECSSLLQHLMLQKNIQSCHSSLVAIRSIAVASRAPRGLLLDFPKPDDPHLFIARLTEARTEGLEGIYELLTSSKTGKKGQPSTQVLFDDADSSLRFRKERPPLVWSIEKERFLDSSTGLLILHPGDLFFLFNEGILRFYKNRKEISNFLSKVTQVFAVEGLETLSSMLQKELSLASKKKKLSEDLHLIVFQVLYTPLG